MGSTNNNWGCLNIIMYAIIGWIAFMFLPIVLWIVVGYLIYRFFIKSSNRDNELDLD